MKKKLLITFLILLGLSAAAMAFLARRPAGVNVGETQWGVAFSKYYSEKIGLNWRETYLAMLDELKPKALRLPIYWPDVEPQTGVYNFSDYDWMIEQAKIRGVEKLILVIGRRTPRWPECHVPEWAASLNNESQKTLVLKLLPVIVERYKAAASLYAWQVENEPFLAFGECPKADAGFLDQEIALVRSVDAAHPIMLTDSGELSFWLGAAKRADIFGTTMYRVVWNSWLGYFKYPLPPRFFWIKANLTRLFYPSKPIIVSELQAEYWGHRMPNETPIEEQLKEFSLAQFRENINYARQVGFSETYLWGVEWWWWMKQKGQPEYWEEAGKMLNY